MIELKNQMRESLGEQLNDNDDDYSDEKFENTEEQQTKKKAYKETLTSGEGGLKNIQDLQELLSSPTSQS